MKSISSLALVAAVLFVAGSNASDDNQPSQGCFSSTLGLKVVNTTDIYTSKGSCSVQCAGSDVFALTNSTWCYCGSQLPPADTKVDDSSCNTPCPGFPANTCMFVSMLNHCHVSQYHHRWRWFEIHICVPLSRQSPRHCLQHQ